VRRGGQELRHGSGVERLLPGAAVGQ
jgi:hypothetical protein